jgi:hypothetical protein
LHALALQAAASLLARFDVMFVVLHPLQGAPTTKGCGLVTMGSNEEAVAAIDALDNRHVWDGMEAPMVVKWMDAALQKRRREEHLAAMRQGLVPSMSMSESTLTGLCSSKLRPCETHTVAASRRTALQDSFAGHVSGCWQLQA